jgi:hypothetical protein
MLLILFLSFGYAPWNAKYSNHLGVEACKANLDHNQQIPMQSYELDISRDFDNNVRRSDSLRVDVFKFVQVF